jgi:hypothetical protein
MARKLRYTEKVIKSSLKDNLDLCKKALLAMWQYNPELNSEYTPEEMTKMDGFRTEFRSQEASFLGSLAGQLQEKGFLSENQLKAVKNRMPKYAPMLTELANKETRLAAIALPDSEAIRTAGRKLVWFETKAGKDGPFEQPDVFPARSGNAVKARIPTSDTEALCQWYPKKCIELHVRDGVTFIGIPVWLCEKNQLPLELAVDSAQFENGPEEQPEEI